jgi:hypothetical protein
LAADRYGLSFYSYDAICNFLKLTLEQYIQARNVWMEKDLVAFDGTPFSSAGIAGQPTQANVHQSVISSTVMALAGKMFKEV